MAMRNPIRRRGCQVAILATLAVLVVFAVVFWWLWTSVPDYWIAHQKFLANTPPQRMQELAHSLQRKVLSLTYAESGSAYNSDGGGRVTGDGAPPPPAIGSVRRLVVSTEEVNAWLNVELPRWLANQHVEMPPQVTQPMIAIDGERVILAFQYESTEIRPVISAVFHLTFADGQIGMRREALKAGKAPVPTGLVVRHLRKQKAGEAEGSAEFESVMNALDGRMFPATFPLDEVRSARLQDLKMSAEQVEMEFKVERRD